MFVGMHGYSIFSDWLKFEWSGMQLELSTKQ